MNNDSFGQTDTGKCRAHNEDCYIAQPEEGLWLIADGMGGHAAGEVASSLACREISQLITQNTCPIEAIQRTHQTIKTAPSKGIGSKGMGTTVVLVTLTGHRYTISWVGDSRAYIWSPDTLTQISKDHSLVQQLLDNGTISEPEARTHPQRNVILQSLGSETLEQINVEQRSGILCQGEKLLLCSDGLNNDVDDGQIHQIIKANPDSADAVQALITQANHNGGRDNISIIIINALDDAPPRSNNEQDKH